VPRFEVLLAVHDVHLLKGEGLGLVQEEVHHDARGQIGAAKNETKAVADAVSGVWSEEANHKVTCKEKASVLRSDDDSEESRAGGLPSQLPAVARDACFALVRRGLQIEQSVATLLRWTWRVSYKLSPMTTQAKGPQVIAKDAMNMQAATIMTMPELSYSVGGLAMATEAKISSHADCQRAP